MTYRYMKKSMIMYVRLFPLLVACLKVARKTAPEMTEKKRDDERFWHGGVLLTLCDLKSFAFVYAGKVIR